MPTVRSQFTPRVRTSIDFEGEKIVTQQHFKEEVDVNNIIAKFAQTGELPVAREAQQYGYAPSQTFTEAMFIITEAKEEFAKLPSAARAAFGNDPAKYLDAATDAEQRPLFEELGLLDKLPDPTKRRSGDTHVRREEDKKTTETATPAVSEPES